MSGKVVLDSLSRNVSRLMAENRRLRDEVLRLGASKERLSEQNRELSEQMAVMERRLIIKELAAGFGAKSAGEGGKGGEEGDGSNGYVAGLDRRGAKVARARVNRLLREVDKCIALLGAEQNG